MKLLNTLAVSLLLSAVATVPSFADSVDNTITVVSPSIIMVGSPDPCDNGGCEEETASTEEADDRNGSLIDAYGMPTSIPVVIRPTVVNQTSSENQPAAADGSAEAPAAEAPAAAAPAPAATPEVAAAPPAPAGEPATPTAAPQSTGSGGAVN